ncbi:ribose-phosphate pyrophosphokinase [bacterium]|nr:ribose-phosphate pyrophosphokinase [bacterium]
MEMELKVISGNSNRLLAEGIVKYLGIDLVAADVKRFSDGEIFVQINDNVRGADVFVVQSTCPPANDNLMELLIIIDALKRSSAGRITAIVPYYGYARQDRKVQPRVPITAKLVADLITIAGADRLLTMDLHAGQIQGFFDIPVDNLYSTPVMIDYIRKLKFSQNLVIVSPDAGGVERARAYAKLLNASLSIIDKRRDAPNQSEVMNIIGDVKGKDAFIVDDIVDTAGTLTKSASALKKAGARSVNACCTHAVLSGSAVERIERSDIERMVVTDTIQLVDSAKVCEKIVVLSVAGIVGEAIHRINVAESVSSLFSLSNNH